MSKSVQAGSALEIARKQRQSGYKTRMHTPELAELRAWFDKEWATGGKSIKSLHREAVNRFPKLKVPAEPTLKNYVEKHYEPPVVSQTAYAPDYLKYIEKFDSYIKLSEYCEEVWTRYLAAKEKEKLPISRKGSESFQWAQEYRASVLALNDMEIKLKLRSGIVVPGTLNVNNTQNNVTNVEGDVNVTQLAEVEAVLADRDKIIEWEERVRGYANSQRAKLDTLAVGND